MRCGRARSFNDVASKVLPQVPLFCLTKKTRRISESCVTIDGWDIYIYLFLHVYVLYMLCRWNNSGGAYDRLGLARGPGNETYTFFYALVRDDAP